MGPAPSRFEFPLDIALFISILLLSGTGVAVEFSPTFTTSEHREEMTALPHSEERMFSPQSDVALTDSHEADYGAVDPENSGEHYRTLPTSQAEDASDH